MKEGNSMSEAIEQAPQTAWADYEMNIYQRMKFKYPPKAYVVFRSKSYIYIYLQYLITIWPIVWGRYG